MSIPQHLSFVAQSLIIDKSKIPAILYHGTTDYRYVEMKESGFIKCDVRRIHKSSEGYCYFTDSIRDAYMWGAYTCMEDKKNESRPIVLALKTSLLRERIELDPETLPSSRMTRYNKTWYRIKGDIELNNTVLIDSPDCWTWENEKENVFNDLRYGQ